jgi:hypothetical protein
MANPVPVIIEALGAHMDGWQPADGRELMAFLDSLPELAEKLHDTLNSVFSDLAADRHITSPVIDSSDEFLAHLRDAQDDAPDIAVAFREANKFWLGGDDA